MHIKEWLKVFPRKQIFITRTEAFAKNIADTLLGIFRFLHLGMILVIQHQQTNKQTNKNKHYSWFASRCAKSLSYGREFVPQFSLNLFMLARLLSKFPQLI